MPRSRPPIDTDATPPIVSSIRTFTDRGSASFPRPLTPLIARDPELATVIALLRDPAVRLLTLTGPGGVGKTRLAIAAASGVTNDFPDGVVLVDLSPVRNPELVLTTIARCLGLRDIGAESLHDRLPAVIADRRLLLVLDNFEQVVVAGPRVRELLDVCPEMSLLVTSRVRLRISGERELPVTPLPIDAPASTGDPGLSGAIQLFVERARAIRPDFDLNAETTPAVAEIVRRVDGLPLAIELAAARIKVLPPAALLQRLEQRLPLLSGGARDMPLRQQTMRDTIGWSYDLLSDAERTLFRRLGVFVGGFTLEAAGEIGTGPNAAGGGLPENTPFETVDGIAALIDHSLLRQSAGPEGEPRYQMLETVREYARDRLEATGEIDLIHRRHAVFFTAFAEAAGRELDRTHTAARIERIEADHDNLRTALGWLAQTGEPEMFLRLVRSLVTVWIFHGPHEEGRSWLEQALAQGRNASPPLRRQALYGLGVLAVNQDDVTRAEDCFNESLNIAQAHGDPAGVSYGRFGLGLLAMHRRRFDRAATQLEEAVAMARRMDDPMLASVRAGLALSFLGASAYAQNALSLAASRFHAALVDQRAVDTHWGIALSLVGLGYTVRDQGDLAQAGALLADGLARFTGLRDHRMIALALDGVAGIAVVRGQPERAARLFGAAMALRDADGLPVEPAFRAAHERGIAAARAALGETRFTACLAEGATLPLATVAEEATAIAAPGDGPAAAASPPSPAVRFGLTLRELEVLRLLTEGMSDREIAETLSISDRTAGNHVQHAMQKIGVESRTAAAVFAVRHGLD